MNSSEIKLGIITRIISEYMVAVRTVRNAFKLVTQLVTQITDLVGLIWQVIPQSASLFIRFEHTPEGMHACMRPRRRCLSIPTHTRHYTVVVSPLIHQAVPLSRHRSRITDTLELCCALTGASRPEHNQGSARLYATETPMYEHPYAHPALHGGGTPAHSSSGSAQPTTP